MYPRITRLFLILDLVSTSACRAGSFPSSQSTTTSLLHQPAFVRSCPAPFTTSSSTSVICRVSSLPPPVPFPALLTAYSDSRDRVVSVEAKTGGYADENGGTTGGKGKKKTTVSSTRAFLKAIRQKGSLAIRVKGNKIKLSGMEKVESDKTIIGVGNNKATVRGGGLEIKGVSNVIVQNILFADIKGKKKDAISIDNSKNVWIDHCDFTKTNDGMVDVKRGSDYVTVSWNHFIGPHQKTCLLGHDDDNGKQDKKHLTVTYHHNWFDGTKERHPRVRFSKLCHVYNNYYSENQGYGVASTMKANVLVEHNYFEGVDRPTLVGYGTSGSGKLDGSAIGTNVFVNCGRPETKGNVDIGPPYNYNADRAREVRNVVRDGAGRGLN